MAKHVAPDIPFEAVVLAASAGGLETVSGILAALPASFGAPVVVVQHGATPMYARVLDRRSALEVRMAEPGGGLPLRGVVILPLALGLAPDGPGNWRFAEVQEADARPADAAFGALAATLGRRLIAVVLSGRLNDGARGVRAVKRAGGRVIIQDPATATAAGMPTHALATGCVDFVLPPAAIPSALVALAMAPGGAELLAVATPSWAAY